MSWFKKRFNFAEIWWCLHDSHSVDSRSVKKFTAARYTSYNISWEPLSDDVEGLVRDALPLPSLCDVDGHHVIIADILIQTSVVGVDDADRRSVAAMDLQLRSFAGESSRHSTWIGPRRSWMNNQ